MLITTVNMLHTVHITTENMQDTVHSTTESDRMANKEKVQSKSCSFTSCVLQNFYSLWLKLHHQVLDLVFKHIVAAETQNLSSPVHLVILIHHPLHRFAIYTEEHKDAHRLSNLIGFY